MRTVMLVLCFSPLTGTAVVVTASASRLWHMMHCNHSVAVVLSTRRSQVSFPAGDRLTGCCWAHVPSCLGCTLLSCGGKTLIWNPPLGSQQSVNQLLCNLTIVQLEKGGWNSFVITIIIHYNHCLPSQPTLSARGRGLLPSKPKLMWQFCMTTKDMQKNTYRSVCSSDKQFILPNCSTCRAIWPRLQWTAAQSRQWASCPALMSSNVSCPQPSECCEHLLSYNAHSVHKSANRCY